jgi:hypothetical protein
VHHQHRFQLNKNLPVAKNLDLQPLIGEGDSIEQQPMMTTFPGEIN